MNRRRSGLWEVVALCVFYPPHQLKVYCQSELSAVSKEQSRIPLMENNQNSISSKCQWHVLIWKWLIWIVRQVNVKTISTETESLPLNLNLIRAIKISEVR